MQVTRFAVITLLLLCSVADAYASLTDASYTGPTQNVVLGRTSSITLTWSLTDVTTAPGSTTVSSSKGDYCLTIRCTVVVGSRNRAISQSYISSGTGLFPYVKQLTLTETVPVPVSIIHNVYKRGTSTFVYQRSFVSSNGAVVNLSASATLRISSAQAGGFYLSRLVLRFTDGASMKVVEQQAELGIRAELGFNGTGLLRGVWEVADPTTTAGKPVYRPLQTVRRYLSRAQTETVIGPTLPTQQNGLYLVRLRITDPLPDYEQPVLRYFVGKDSKAVSKITLFGPTDRVSLTPQLLFHWRAVKDARVYQLEFHTDMSPAYLADLPDMGGQARSTKRHIPDRQSPVAGVTVPAKQTSIKLSPVNLRHLQSGQRYLWQVIAINSKGVLIGKSELRHIVVP